MSWPRDDEQGWDATPPGGVPQHPQSEPWAAGYAGPPVGQPAAAQPFPPQVPTGAVPWGPQPGWGPSPGAWWTPPAPPPPAWPRGPGRPQQATAAATLGFIAGGIAVLWGLVAIVLLAGSDGGTSAWLGIAVGIPSGAALIVGGARLLGGADRWFVVGGGAALALAVLLQAVVSAASSYGSAIGQALLVVFLLPVPTIAAVLAGLPVVGGWVGHVRSRPGP